MKKLLDLMMAQKPYVAAYASDNVENRIWGGEGPLHVWWDGNSMKLRVNDMATVAFAMPEDGLVGGFASLAAPKRAARIDNAKTFIGQNARVERPTVPVNDCGQASPVAIYAANAMSTAENASNLFPTVRVGFARACLAAAQNLVRRVAATMLQ